MTKFSLPEQAVKIVKPGNYKRIGPEDLVEFRRTGGEAYGPPGEKF